MNNKDSDYLSDSGEHRRSSVRLSKHVQKKIQDHYHHHQRSTSVTSDEVFLDEDQESTALSGRSSLNRKRENTFTTYLIQRPIVESASLKLLPLRKNFKEEIVCQKCVRYEEVLRERNQRLVNFEEQNRKINTELRSMTLKTRQFQEENFHLKRRLQRLTLYLRQYEEKFEAFKGKKQTQTKSQSDADHLRRLRHEVHSYNQAIAVRQQQEERRFSHLYRSQYR